MKKMLLVCTAVSLLSLLALGCTNPAITPEGRVQIVTMDEDQYTGDTLNGSLIIGY